MIKNKINISNVPVPLLLYSMWRECQETKGGFLCRESERLPSSHTMLN